MSEDPRCCGSGTCIINAEGHCWCGQQWNGVKMSHAPLPPSESPDGADVAQQPLPPTGGDSGPATRRPPV